MKAASLALLISRTIAFVHASSILPSYGVLVSMERWLMFQHTQEKGLRETGWLFSTGWHCRHSLVVCFNDCPSAIAQTAGAAGLEILSQIH